MINLLLQALSIGVIVPAGIVAVAVAAIKVFGKKEIDHE
jgi:hypothetical protein